MDSEQPTTSADNINDDNVAIETDKTQAAVADVTEAQQKRPIAQYKKDKCAMKGMALLLQQMRSQQSGPPAKIPRPDQEENVLPAEDVNSNGDTEKLEKKSNGGSNGESEISALNITKITEAMPFSFPIKFPPKPRQLDEEKKERVHSECMATTIDVPPVEVIRDCFHDASRQNVWFSSSITTNNYVRSCKWRPDGLALFAESADYCIRVFNYGEDKKLELASSTQMGGLIYDVQWHPHVDLYAMTSREAPIHLIDSNGKCRMSFRGIDYADELDYAYSLAFSLDGWTLYGGYYKTLRIFDLGRPGRHVREIATFVKGEMSSNQKAVLSAITACPTMYGVYAVGSYLGSVGLYSDHTGQCDALIPTHDSGVTHLQYSKGGNELYVGYRKSSVIECYDLRFPIKVLSTFHRPAATCQRFYFQLDSEFERYLFSGSSTGSVLIYDLKDSEYNNQRTAAEMPIGPRWSLPVSRAALTGLSVHSNQPILATSSGERVFPRPKLCESDLSSSEDDSATVKNSLHLSRKKRNERTYARLTDQNELDNSLRLFEI